VDSVDESRINNFDLDIVETVDDELNSKIELKQFDTAKLKSRYLSRGELSKEHILARLNGYIEDTHAHDESILHKLRLIFDDSHYLLIDIIGGQVFNIIPSKVKIPEDSAKKAGIGKDGSGLYSTLYALKRNEDSRRIMRRRYFMPYDDYEDFGNVKLPDLLEYIQLGNSSIANIDVQNDPFDNQLTIRIGIEGEKESSIFPLSSMSDGTIKWITLVTIVKITKTIFSIEEPENYLHPLMQAEIVNIMRSSLSKRQFILMSTHSETILNNAKPEEIVIVSFKNGRTSVSRPQNVDCLNDEIKKTGFGLGYYYIAGSLND
jgi:hypothetical protein